MDIENDVVITKVEGLPQQNDGQGVDGPSQLKNGQDAEEKKSPKQKRKAGRPRKYTKVAQNQNICGTKRNVGRPRKGMEKAPPPRVQGERKSGRQPVVRREEKFYKETWTYDDKKLLLKAIKRHSPTDYQVLSEVVETKSPIQIEAYMQKIKRKLEWKGPSKLHIPLERWLHTTSELVSPEVKDYTECFSTIMSIISSFEDFPKPNKDVPDYSAIYRYLSCVLQGKELPELGCIESAVLLDLLHSLVEVLKTHDTSQQRKVMKWKYQLLNTKVNLSQCMQYVQKARKAITNDFSDMEPSTCAQGPKHSLSSTSQLVQMSRESQSHSLRHGSNSHSHSSETVGDRKSHSSGMARDQSGTFTIKSVDPQPSCSSQSHDLEQSASRSDKSSCNKRKLVSETVPEKQKATEVDDDSSIPKKKSKIDEDPNIPHKPSLFTLNPLCIPVHLLKLKKIVKICAYPDMKPKQIAAIMPKKREKPQFRPDDSCSTEISVRHPSTKTSKQRQLLCHIAPIKASEDKD